MLPSYWGLEDSHPEVANLAKEAGMLMAEAKLDVAPRWLSILGSCGTGKTHVAKEIIRRAKSRTRWWCKFARWGDSIDRIRDKDYKHVQWLIDYDVLALDDIGAEYGSDYATRTLGKILDARLGKWTVLTSNLQLGEIAETLDSRIASRMVRQGSRICSMKTAPDYCLNQLKTKNK